MGVPWGARGSLFFSKFNQIWCVSYLHEWHMQCNGTVFWVPPSKALGRGQKVNININKSQLHSQFQRFLNQTLCVFSQMKDIKHIRRYFQLVAWVIPQGWDLGVWWGFGVNFFSLFNQIWCLSYVHEWHMQRHNFLGLCPLRSLGGAKRSNI